MAIDISWSTTWLMTSRKIFFTIIRVAWVAAAPAKLDSPSVKGAEAMVATISAARMPSWTIAATLATSIAIATPSSAIAPIRAASARLARCVPLTLPQCASKASIAAPAFAPSSSCTAVWASMAPPSMSSAKSRSDVAISR